MTTADAPTVRPSRRRIPRTRRLGTGLPASGVRLSVSSAWLTCSPEAGSRKPEAGLYDQIRHFRLLDLQIRLRLQHLAHLQAIGLLVALRPRRPHGRAARSIQQAKLDSHRVGDLAHDAAECVHFAHQVSLGDAANGRIARHLCDQVDVERVQSGLQAHARGGHGGLAPGMAGSDHNYVELFGELHANRVDANPRKFLELFLLLF